MNKTLNIWDRFLSLIQLIIMVLGIILIQQITLIPLESTINIPEKGVQLVLTIITIMLQAVFFFAVYKISERYSWKNKKVSRKKFFILLTVGIISVIIIQCGTSWLQNAGIITESRDQNIALHVFEENPVGFYILVCFLGPISEELIFRGFLINKFINIFGYSITSKIISAICSSLIFAAMHNQNSLINFFPFMLVGILLSTLYIQSEKIIIPVIVHICLNLYTAI